MTDRLSRRALLLGAAGTVCGCAGRTLAPPLDDLYARSAASSARPPLILIPGAFGTRLRRRSDGQELWPGTNFALLFSNYEDLAVEIDSATLEPRAGDIETSGLVLEAFGRDFYRSLLDTLETAGGYRRGSTDAPVAGSGLTYYVYEYDWRLDMAASVRGLHELIERVAEIHGDAGQKVDILAHSSGGLLARYYARYGATDLLGESSSAPDDPGSHHIRRLLLVGTPNLGTMQAVLSLFRGEEVGLRHIPEEVVATCPSVAQLMPDPGEKCLLDLQGDPLDLDLYDIESWRELRWALFSDEARDRVRRRHGSSTSAATYLEVLEAYMAEQLTRGRRFHELLAAPLEPEEPRPFVFGGDCTPTLSHLVVSHERGEYRGYENPKRIPRSAGTIDFAALMNEPGDGNVTRSSLMGRMSADDLGAEELGVAHAVFSCSSHKTLMAHPGFQDNLLYALLEHEQERAP